MKYIKGIILGFLIGCILGGWAGYNKGRGAPYFVNPFAEYTLSDRIKDDADSLYKDTKESIRKSLE